MKRQWKVVGAFIKIKLPNGRNSYGRILENANYAFYDLITENDNVNLEQIANQKILFIVAVYDDAITSGRWIKIGKLPLEPDLQLLPPKFIQDKLNPDSFELYNPNTGNTKSVIRQDCIGLERAAVWEPNQVEDRIIDYLNSKPNIWVERMKA